ncbi:hypothetical protein OF83DRAFT_1115177 [Amylostereum chailletii]|nr:hypothetical protein OF83DRAFT_1115177 [Amylostereum chailletii]
MGPGLGVSDELWRRSLSYASVRHLSPPPVDPEQAEHRALPSSSEYTSNPSKKTGDSVKTPMVNPGANADNAQNVACTEEVGRAEQTPRVPSPAQPPLPRPIPPRHPHIYNLGGFHVQTHQAEASSSKQASREPKVESDNATIPSLDCKGETKPNTAQDRNGPFRGCNKLKYDIQHMEVDLRRKEKVYKRLDDDVADNCKKLENLQRDRVQHEIGVLDKLEDEIEHSKITLMQYAEEIQGDRKTLERMKRRLNECIDLTEDD